MCPIWGPALIGLLPFAPVRHSWSLLETTVALGREGVVYTRFRPVFIQTVPVSQTPPLHRPRDHPLVALILQTPAAE